MTVHLFVPPMLIGHYSLPNNVLLAPMAGITDRPFRELCTGFGAGLTVSEMVISNPGLQQHPKVLKRTDFGDTGLKAAQIVGADPAAMALAARLNQDRGAQIIDINMGCPAKKVCSVAAGSALLRDEALVARILRSVVNAVEIPVTLKIRTGWEPAQRNAPTIARIAQSEGITALTVHGRTRACKFAGAAEYDTIREVKQSVGIPVVANGDIDSVAKARQVLRHTGADAIMVGRAALGKPWIFRELTAGLEEQGYAPPTPAEIKDIVSQHLESLYSFYGNYLGVRIARKHIGWYFQQLGALPADRKTAILQAQQPELQRSLVDASFNFIIPRAA